MDGIEIRVHGATPLEVLARLGAFGLEVLANEDVSKAARAILEAEQRTENKPEEAAPVKPAAAPAPVTPVAAPVAAPTMEQVVPTVPTAAPTMEQVVPTVPTAAPAYSLDDITRAGADFLVRHPDKQEQLNALFPQFGITTLAELRQDQMGAFATAMRGLGVTI